MRTYAVYECMHYLFVLLLPRLLVSLASLACLPCRFSLSSERASCCLCLQGSLCKLQLPRGRSCCLLFPLLGPRCCAVRLWVNAQMAVEMNIVKCYFEKYFLVIEFMLCALTSIKKANDKHRIINITHTCQIRFMPSPMHVILFVSTAAAG